MQAAQSRQHKAGKHKAGRHPGMMPPSCKGLLSGYHGTDESWLSHAWRAAGAPMSHGYHMRGGPWGH